MVQVAFTQDGSWLSEVTKNLVPVDSDKLKSQAKVSDEMETYQNQTHKLHELWLLYKKVQMRSTSPKKSQSSKAIYIEIATVYMLA